MESTKALDGLIEAVSAQIPANPLAPKNIRAAEAMEHELRRYFNSINNALTDDLIAGLYHKHVRD